PPLALKPRRGLLAKAALSRIGRLPDTGKGSRPCRKGEGRSSTGTFPPKTRNCRATRFPTPDSPPPKRLAVPEPRPALPPLPARNPRRGPAGAGRFQARRPADPVAVGPKAGVGKAREKAEAFSEPLASLTIGSPRAPHPSRLRLRRAEARGRGPHRRCPALSRARECSRETPGATI